ncbi:allantoate deiminase [Clostridium psychrophilum]|uniref:allantoate deiminase n=1 Tax=Clostridium psychrophilum TaxID=132926 RepID=UPI001C0B64FA|nr:allantoate deiminase [Clostridium psychrophilum]MBU3180832.1 allantoate deiminase [Clostridium psychrophilum]
MFDIEEETIKLLKWLGGFGKDSAGGVTRLLYTQQWIEAQDALKKTMEDEGFSAYYDEVGNLFGTLKGKSFKDETIMTGSHVDTVKNGGIYDGQFGIVAGIVAVKYLKEKYGKPLRNIEIVSIAEEEGSRFPYTFWGSKNIFGIAKTEDVENIKDENGISFVDDMRKCGFDFKNEHNKIRDDLKVFLEVHIEQGGVLEIEKKSVGIVTNIVGQRRFNINIKGQANHAGTTPMRYRKDALVISSSIINLIMDLAKKYGDPLVATVGKIEVMPNIVNVVPGNSLFTLDIRHTDKNILVKFTDDIILKIKKIASKEKVEINIDMWMDVDPVPMNKDIVKVVKNQCDKFGVNYKIMYSGAGHDSQIVAKFVPTAMLFVPSHNGISHSPEEYTLAKDLAEGVKILIHSIYELAYK